jgi:hypothetical protein
MEYKTDRDLRDFKAWSGAKETLKILVKLDKCDEVEAYIEECMINPTETDINDFLWFEDEYIAVDILGFKSIDEFYKEKK